MIPNEIIANFVLKFPNFRYHGNKGWPLVNLNDAIKLRYFENPCLMQDSWPQLLHKPNYG